MTNVIKISQLLINLAFFFALTEKRQINCLKIMNIETKTKRKFVWIVGLACLFGVLVATSAQAQVKVGDNPTTIDARSVLELESTTQGLYLPRLTTAELGAVTGWKEGMVVYNTDDDCIKVYDGTTWDCVGSDLSGIYSGSGSLSGNTVVTGGANTLDFTTTAVDGFSVDGTTFSVDGANNRIGIGTASPGSEIELQGGGTPNVRLHDPGNAEYNIGIVAGGDLSLGGSADGTSNRLTLNSSGDLTVHRNLTVNGNLIEGNGGHDIMAWNPNGGNATVTVGGAPSSQTSYNLLVDGSFAIGDLSATTHYGFPLTRGSNGQVLQLNSSGVLLWTTPGGSDGNGIYSGSGSLSGNTVVTGGANTLDFTTTATDGFSVDGTTFSVDGANNRIGIGTASPGSEIELQGGGTPNVRLHDPGNAEYNIGIVAGGDLSLGGSADGTSNRLTLNSSGDLTVHRNLTVNGNLIEGNGGHDIMAWNPNGGNATVTVGGAPSSQTSYNLLVDGSFAIGDLSATTHYGFPLTRGSNGQVLQLNSSGALLWTTPNEGNTVTVTNISAAYTVVAADHAIFNTSTAGSTVAITLPNPASHTGRIIKIINTNSTAGGTVTFAGSHLPQGTISQLNPQASGSLISNGTNWYWYSSF